LVSVVVPTRNRSEQLRDCLLSLLQQDYTQDSYEIVVVNNGSSDSTSAVVEEISRSHPMVEVREVLEPAAGLNRARNRGIEMTHGSLIWFVDDDEIVARHALRRLTWVLDMNRDVWAAGGPCLPLPMQPGMRPRTMCATCWARFKAWGDPAISTLVEVEELPGGNTLIAKTAFEKIGLFEPWLSGSGDDSEWFARARACGGRFLYDPEGWVWHRIRPEEIRFSALLRKRLSSAVKLAGARRFMKARSSSQDLKLALHFLGHGARRACILGLVNGTGWLLSATLPS
jgi:glycosyltransferase involved in cell wall biosynthesis